jgi:hypothetical protein
MGIGVPFAKSAGSRFPLIAMRYPAPLGVCGVVRYRDARAPFRHHGPHLQDRPSESGNLHMTKY